jgi:hypothetical protein
MSANSFRRDMGALVDRHPSPSMAYEMASAVEKATGCAVARVAQVGASAYLAHIDASFAFALITLLLGIEVSLFWFLRFTPTEAVEALAARIDTVDLANCVDGSANQLSGEATPSSQERPLAGVSDNKIFIECDWS